MVNFPQELKKFEIEASEKPKSVRDLKKTHVSFTGSLLKHPHDPQKVILVADPYSSSNFYYEFRTADISYAEKLPSIVNVEGKTMIRVRIWVKKTSVGILCKPFLVEDTGR